MNGDVSRLLDDLIKSALLFSVLVFEEHPPTWARAKDTGKPKSLPQRPAIDQAQRQQRDVRSARNEDWFERPFLVNNER